MVCYTSGCGSVPHSGTIREASWCRWELTRDLQWDNVKRLRDFGALSPQWDDSIKSLPLRLRDLCGEEGGRFEKPKVVADSKKTLPSRHNRYMYKLKKIKAAGTRLTQFQATPGPSTESRKWTQAPTSN